MATSYRFNMTFEAEARRVAEAVWRLAPGTCQAMHYPNDPVVREIDGIARLRDISHLLMVTTSTRLDKIKDDVKKLGSAETIERTRAAAVSKWIITQKQLDAQHVEFARKSNVLVLTLEQFQRRFFDSGQYLNLRLNWAFGSARDPLTDSVNIGDKAYVALPMSITKETNETGRDAPVRPVTVQQLAQMIGAGEIVVLRAPFGSGKSVTTRELFKLLAAEHRRDPSRPIPLALNLREHWGEDHSDEILERHARAIGYRPLEDVVVAWRSGMCCLLLDGFDEVASQTVVRADNKLFMREARRKALQGVRDFTQALPHGVGVFLCGRDHYFDTISELANSLGIPPGRCKIVDLSEFTEESANEFLRRNGVTQQLPAWLPRKPLLLSYLLRNDLFGQVLQIDGSKGFGFAWDAFLDRICEREAALPGAAMEPSTVRAVLERLADSVRAKASGTGPITGSDLASAYQTETGQTAGDTVLAQLQRLPGLAQRDAEASNRSFVDHDLLAALQGSAFARQVLTGFQLSAITPLSALSHKAVGMAAYVLAKNEAGVDTLLSTSDLVLKRSRKGQASPQFVADCLTVAFRLAIDTDQPVLDFRGAVVDGASFDRIPLDEISLRAITFKNCAIRELALGESTDTRSTSFSNCLIVRICGVASEAGLPREMIGNDCEVESYDDMDTTTAVLRSNLGPQLKALVIVLRRLYKQAGGGRKLTAFVRGMTRPEVVPFVDPVIALLVRHGFISIFSSVAHPVRNQAGRVEGILASPVLSEDVVAIEARSLK